MQGWVIAVVALIPKSQRACFTALENDTEVQHLSGFQSYYNAVTNAVTREKPMNSTHTAH